jgi:hypothetical protein
MQQNAMYKLNDSELLIDGERVEMKIVKIKKRQSVKTQASNWPPGC